MSYDLNGRRFQNGVSYPIEGTRQYCIWELINGIVRDIKKIPEYYEIVPVVTAYGFKRATVENTFRLWRKFHGLTDKSKQRMRRVLRNIKNDDVYLPISGISHQT